MSAAFIRLTANKYYNQRIYGVDMTNTFVIRTVTALACLVSIAGQAYAQSKSHQFTLRVECRKGSDRGCTASARVCANAPEGYYFAAGQSIAGAHNNSWSPGHAPVCGTATTGAEGVPINGLLAPISMCAGLHAESGSGGMNIGKVAFVNCNYTATIYPIPKY